MDLKISQTSSALLATFVLLMAFLFFYFPILVFILSISLVLFLTFKSKLNFFKRKPIAGSSKPKTRLNANTLTASGLRYGLSSNVRPIKAARRVLSHETRTDDNYVNYLTNNLNPNYFLQSDGLMSSMSGQSLSSRLHSPNDMYYSSISYRPFRESPNSQLGNIPFVKLTTSGSEPSTQELKLKTSTVRPVTVRIAPMPQNLSNYTLSRLSNTSAGNVSAHTSTDTPFNAMAGPSSSTQTQLIVDALKRKRGQKAETESEDPFKVVANKKAKRDSLNTPQMANGLVFPNKQSFKRQAVDGTALLHKKFKNNEILSSYSSLQTPQLTPNYLKTKRKLTPDSTESVEVKTKRNLLPKEVEEYSMDSSAGHQMKSNETNNLSINLNKDREEATESAPKRSYALPLHLHSMEDHERDRNKARNRLSRFLNAVKEVKSPNKDLIEVQTTASDVIQTSSSAEIVLPSVPAAAIFTNSRVETIVTTTLLNTPISSVMTTTRESLSPQKLNIDNTDNCSMSSAPNSPEVSTIITTFSSSTPLPTPILSTNSTSKSIELTAKPIANATTSASIASMPSQSLVTSNNLFNNTSTFGIPVSTQSSANQSTPIVIPQFTASAPLPIPNFSQMAPNSANPFTAPPLEAPKPQTNVFLAEPTNSFFNVGATSSSRRPQTSRLRTRTKR